MKVEDRSAVMMQLEKASLITANALAVKIENGLLKDGFTLRDVLHKHWSELADSDAARLGLAMLLRGGWIRGDGVGERGWEPGNEWWRTARFTINPELYGRSKRLPEMILSALSVLADKVEGGKLCGDFALDDVRRLECPELADEFVLRAAVALLETEKLAQPIDDLANCRRNLSSPWWDTAQWRVSPGRL